MFRAQRAVIERLACEYSLVFADCALHVVLREPQIAQTFVQFLVFRINVV